MPFLAAASAVTWAANGVDLREPLNPAPPADSHAITLPSRSVSVTIVLLNEVLMWAWPTGMFFRTRRRPLLRAGLACGTGYAFLVRVISAFRPSASARSDHAAAPCARAHWSSCADRAPADRDGAAHRGRTRSPAAASHPASAPGADRPRRSARRPLPREA